MKHKWMVVLTILVLISILLAPASAAPTYAQANAQDALPNCPPYQPDILNEEDVWDALPHECIRAYKEMTRQAKLVEAPEPTTPPAMANSYPDRFGYTYGGVPNKPIGATINTGLKGDDAFTGPINIGFSFPFYGVSQTQLYINTNGLITFGAGSRAWGGSGIPNDVNPNNLIAVLWDDLLVGAPYNNGGVYYSRGGTAPNRYFVVEWRNIENFYNSLASFEAVLYENGDIVVYHGWVPDPHNATVGIEDSSGHLALQYYGGCCWDGKSFRVYYPTAQVARVLVYSVQPSKFVQYNSSQSFAITVANTGSRGTDTYDITQTASTWPTTYYAANGSTRLKDTDGDGNIDTGPLLQGTSTKIIVKIAVPAGAAMGTFGGAYTVFSSSLNTNVNSNVQLNMTIPAAFANVSVNSTDGAMSFLTAAPDRTQVYKATANQYFGSDVAMAQLRNGNYFYAWDKAAAATGGKWAGNIEYALLNRQGSVVRAAGKLTDNTGVGMETWDDSPSIAVAPNGTVGVLWRRYRYDASTNRYNYNIYFATLSAAGVSLASPVTITNNSSWSGDLRFYSPTIAATSDNRFILGWDVNTEGGKHNIWYAVRNANGSLAASPKALTDNDHSEDPILNSLKSGRAIITWRGDIYGPYYAVLSSNGTIFKPTTKFTTSGGSYDAIADAVQLPNGKVALAWLWGSGAEYRILDASYNLENSTGSGSSHEYSRGHSLSVTTDNASNVIMTWMDGDGYNKQVYALASSYSNGGFITNPFVYNTSRDGVLVSWNGQGNAPFQPDPVIWGNAGIAGATLTYTGGSTTADSTGKYSIEVPSGWSGTVTPSKSGYVFTPVNRAYSSVTVSKASQNYTAMPLYTISGNAGVPGVTLSYIDGTEKTVTAQADGKYSFTVPENWIGTVIPSHVCYTFDPVGRTYTYLLSNQPAQDYTPTLQAGSDCADIDVEIKGIQQGRYGLLSGASTRTSFANVDNGPVKIESLSAVPLMAAERLIYNAAGGAPTSFSEMMALPNSQLDTTYWLPWYNSKTLDTQLRLANVSAMDATVQITIGDVVVEPFTITAGASVRKTYPNIDKGPVQIVSDVDIVVTERVLYKVDDVDTSFTEMMAMPAGQLDKIYWLPWYNSKTLDTQIRIANVSSLEANIQVTVGDVVMEPIILAAGGSVRKSFPNLDKGPVKVVSDQEILVSERVIQSAAGGAPISFSEMMALPAGQLDTTYWLPWYNSKTLDTQVRIANVNEADATVQILIGGMDMGSFTLPANTSTRKSFLNLDKGPVQIVSDIPVVVSERVIYNPAGGVPTSFSEMMAMPDGLLDTIYWLPWYNNKGLDTQLRLGVP